MPSETARCAIVGSGLAALATLRRALNVPCSDPLRSGVVIQAHFFAKAELGHNTVVAGPGGIEALDNSTITR